MDMRNFLLIGSIGLLRQRFPRTLPAGCALYWAYIVGLAASEGQGHCGPGEVPKQMLQMVANRTECAARKKMPYIFGSFQWDT